MSQRYGVEWLTKVNGEDSKYRIEREKLLKQMEKRTEIRMKGMEQGSNLLFATWTYQHAVNRILQNTIASLKKEYEDYASEIERETLAQQ